MSWSQFLMMVSRRRRAGGAISSPITQTVPPIFGPYTADDTPEDAFTAGTYASTAGSISSAVAQWTINGVSQPGSTPLELGDTIGLSVLVTDSAANQRTFVSEPQTIPIDGIGAMIIGSTFEVP